MKFATPVFLIIMLFGISLQASVPASMELTFISNDGQWHENVRYKSDLMGGLLFLERDRLTFLFSDVPDFHDWKRRDFSGQSGGRSLADEASVIPNPADYIINSHAYQMIWEGASSHINIKPRVKQEYYHNYILGNDSTKWKSGVSVYKNLYYEDIYPGIDFHIYSQDVILKSDYIVHPGANYEMIRMHYKGVDGLHINEDGHLIIITSVNTVTEHKPIVYQEMDDQRVYIESRYKLEGKVVTFELLESFREDLPLIIDPTLVFSTYSGSRSDNWGSSATHDSRGNMFVGGIALGSNYPITPGAFQEIFGGGELARQTDVVITKFSNDGTRQLYSTFLGGSGNEVLSSLYCTPEDELIALMTTGSSNFPVGAQAARRIFAGGNPTTFQGGSLPFFSGTDIAVVKLSVDGRGLRGGTYFGGSANDGANQSIGLLFNHGDETRGDIGIDSDGNIYIVSTTYSNNIPVSVGALQPTLGGNSDAVVVKFDSRLRQILFSTYYGGSSADGGYGILVDNSNQVFICGGTRSSNLSGMNGLNRNIHGDTDGFVVRIRPDGGAVLSGTYLGTRQYDQAFLMDFDRAGDLYVFGQTLGPYQVSNNVFSNPNSRQFIHKLNSDLNQSLLSTVFGTPNSQRVNLVPTAFMVDICNNIYAVGWGGEANQSNGGNLIGMPVTPDAWRRTTFGTDFYLINFSSNVEELRYATFFGENLLDARDHVDGGTSRFDRFGVVYQAVCASCGGRNAFPTSPGAFGPDNLSSNCNMAGFKFRFDLEGMLLTATTADPQVGCFPFTTEFSFTATQEPVTYLWDFGDGNTSSDRNPAHFFEEPGTYEVKLMIFDPDNCNPVDSSFITVIVNDPSPDELEAFICQGDFFEIEGEIFTQSGQYEIPIVLENGCESTLLLTLEVLTPEEIDTSIVLCPREILRVSDDISILEPGDYRLTLTNRGGCDSIVNLRLDFYPDFEPFTEGVSLVCAGDSSVITVEPVMDLITWSNGDTGSSIVVFEPGLYTVTLTDNNGCSRETDFLLENFPAPPLFFDRTMTLFCGDTSVFIGSLEFPEGQFIWTGPDITPDNERITNPEVSTPGVYTLTFVDEFDCVTIEEVTLGLDRNLPEPIIRIKPSCPDDAGGEIEIIELFNITEPYTIELSGGPFESSERGLFTNLVPGTYNLFIEDAVGCFYEVSIVIEEVELIDFDLGPDVLIRLGRSHQLEPEFFNLSSGIDTFFWDPTTWLSCPTCLNPVSTPLDTIEYTLTIIDNNGCVVSGRVSIFVFTPPDIFVPNVFTPNRDGVNDRFIIFASHGLKRIVELKIYDRWGSLVYVAEDIPPNDPKFGWDGTHRGLECNPGVFVFSGVVEYLDGEFVPLSGEVLLYR